MKTPSCFGIALWAYSLALAGCGSNAADCGLSSGSIGSGTHGEEVQQQEYLTPEAELKKNNLESTYAQVITDYLRLVKEEYKLGFDTLYFGKNANGQPDDFPDIRLPEYAEGTRILLVSPEEGARIQKEHKSSYYINLVGSVEDDKAEFIFVTFSNGFAHQFDCFIDYAYDKTEKKYVVLTSRFENYLYRPTDTRNP